MDGLDVAAEKNDPDAITSTRTNRNLSLYRLFASHVITRLAVAASRMSLQGVADAPSYELFALLHAPSCSAARFKAVASSTNVGESGQ
jgi:hypothetical protein